MYQGYEAFHAGGMDKAPAKVGSIRFDSYTIAKQLSI